MSTDQSEIEEQRKYIENLIAHRATALELANEQIRSFDKSVLTLSSGAFGLSIIFLDRIGGKAHDAYDALTVSWGSFLFAIIINLVSYHTSVASVNREVREIDRCIVNNCEYVRFTNWWGRTTKALNFLALASFILGAICLAYVALRNTGSPDFGGIKL